mgnify:CR=1 FL=1
MINYKTTKFKQTSLGPIPEEWEVLDLGGCLEAVIDYRGKTPRKLGGNWSNSGYRAFSARNIENGQVKNENSINFIDKQLYKKWMKIEIKRGDILLTSEGPLGQYYYWDSDEKIVLSQRLFGLRAKKETIDSSYLYQYIKSPIFQSEIKNRETGTTVTGIRQTELLKTRVIVPPLPEQTRIASILSSFDSKIELNRQMNKTLEEIASTIFKRWFVDFEFPNEHGEPYKSSGGKMVESELGMMPEGWRVGPVNDLIQVESGFPFSSSIFDENGSYGLVTIKNVQDGVFVSECANRIDTIPEKMPNYCKLAAGNILLSLTGNVGRICIVTGDNFVLNQRVAVLNPIDKISRGFTYLLFRQKDFQNNLIGIARGTAQQNLSPIDTARLEIIIPSGYILAQFGQIANPIFEALISNLNQINVLSHLRDSLLPRLMSGRIRVTKW